MAGGAPGPRARSCAAPRSRAAAAASAGTRRSIGPASRRRRPRISSGGRVRPAAGASASITAAHGGSTGPCARPRSTSGASSPAPARANASSRNRRGPEAGAARDQHGRRPPGGGRREGSGDPRELRLAPDEAATDDPARHAAHCRDARRPAARPLPCPRGDPPSAAPGQPAQRALGRGVAVLHEVGLDDRLPVRARATTVRKAHGANKPPRLMARLIEFFTRSGELVLDPFAGVGGTLLGAAIARGPRRAHRHRARPTLGGLYRETVEALCAEQDGRGPEARRPRPQRPGRRARVRPVRARAPARRRADAAARDRRPTRWTSSRPTRRTTSSWR